MPKFFFNIVCPDCCVSDLLGKECRDATEANEHARQVAVRLVTDQLLSGEHPSGWIKVEDEEHRPLFVLPFRSVAS